MKKTYLAHPYSHPSRLVRWFRWYQATRLTARIMIINPELAVFSPITHSHPVSMFIGNGLSIDFWLKQDFAFLDSCDIMLIPTQLESSFKSKGIRAEYDRFSGPVRPVMNDGRILWDEEVWLEDFGPPAGVWA